MRAMLMVFEEYELAGCALLLDTTCASKRIWGNWIYLTSFCSYVMLVNILAQFGADGACPKGGMLS